MTHNSQTEHNNSTSNNLSDSLYCSLHSKCFRGVGEKRKTNELDWGSSNYIVCLIAFCCFFPLFLEGGWGVGGRDKLENLSFLQLGRPLQKLLILYLHVLCIYRQNEQTSTPVHNWSLILLWLLSSILTILLKQIQHLRKLHILEQTGFKLNWKGMTEWLFFVHVVHLIIIFPHNFYPQKLPLSNYLHTCTCR